jgi:hypothetical protein
MLKNDLVRLIKTLSKNEKQCFKLWTKKQSVERAYIHLFDLIEQIQITDTVQLEEDFRNMHPGVSFESTSKYLFKVLVDVLVSANADRDKTFQQMQGYMRSKILFDRSLIKEALKELNKVRHAASAEQNYLMEYMASRQELTILSDLNFPEITEESVIELQMTGKTLLRNVLQVHEHNSLYNVLKLRLFRSGKTMSEQAKQTLNDLLLSELSLITSKVAYNFESKKLHLLFQSYFFTSIGDYKSALKTFSELNELFESNMRVLDSNPADYLSCVEGILDSLRTIKAFDDMEFYLEKVKHLQHSKYSDQFIARVEKTILTFRLNLHIVRGEFGKAAGLYQQQGDIFLKANEISDYEKHCELLFFIGLTHFSLHKWGKALRYINRIADFEKYSYPYIIYKAARLLGIMARYELGDIDFINYEIRAYKRSLSNRSSELQLERLIFKLIKLDPNRSSIIKNEVSKKALRPLITTIEHDKFELQLLKFFNFTGWVDQKLSSADKRAKFLVSG